MEEHLNLYREEAVEIVSQIIRANMSHLAGTMQTNGNGINAKTRRGAEIFST